MVLSLAAGTLILLNPGDPRLLFLVPLVLLVRLAFNHIDGLLAHEHGLTSPLGAVLNDICDPVSEAALFLPLAAHPGVPANLFIAAIVLGLIAEMVGRAAAHAGDPRYDVGPMSKKGRGLVFGTIAVLLGAGLAPGPWLGGLLAGTLPAFALTFANRFGRMRIGR